MNNFGIDFFLKSFLLYAQSPMGRVANISIPTALASQTLPEGLAPLHDNAGTATTAKESSSSVIILPSYPEFTGFIFKLQANLDPKHHDRMAFVRVCSGVYQKGMKIQHSRLKKTLTLSLAQSLFAQEREVVENAFPGDIIGIHNPGVFQIGDTIYTGNSLGRVFYPSIPFFSPEKFAMIRNNNPQQSKKYYKGLNDLLEEGVIQLLKEKNAYFDTRGGYENNGLFQGPNILAAVGQLQFDVIEYRLRVEYQVDCSLEYLTTYSHARWMETGTGNGRDPTRQAWEDLERAERDGKLFGVYVVKDRWNRPVLLFRNSWKIDQLLREVDYLKLIPWSLPPAEF
jgi:peptide chain release factor 3